MANGTEKAKMSAALLQGLSSLPKTFVAALRGEKPELTDFAAFGLSNNPTINGEQVAMLVAKCPKLKLQTIPQTCKGDLFCEAVAKHRPEVTAIDLSSGALSKAQLKALLTDSLDEECQEALKNVKEISRYVPVDLVDLYRCRDLDNSKLYISIGCDEKITRGQYILSSLHERLIKVEIPDVKGVQTTDMGLEKLATACRGITSINLRGLEKITDAGLETLGKLCNGITDIDVTDCPQITERVAGLLTHCSGLRLSSIKSNFSAAELESFVAKPKPKPKP